MREVTIERNTNETQIELTLNLDGAGRYQVDTGCGFLNHMLELFARHGRFDLVLICHGDVEVDYHHTTEDVGIALGQAFAQALGDMRGIHRYGSFYLPMDEALILCAVDISGRCTLNWDIHCSTEKVGDFDVECAKEFWLGFARSVPATVHFVQFAGENSHHILEAAFKGAGRCRPHRCGPSGRNSFHERTAGMICIIDYGVGNLFSLKSSLAHLGLEAKVSADAADIRAADRLILPGVGAFGDAMAKLEATGLVPVIKEEAAKKPLLGICLGMQLLFEKSYEYGEHDGLGFVPGQVCPLAPDLGDKSLKVPQIGWNAVHILRDDPLFKYVRDGEYFYYVHSYYGKNCAANTLAVSDYSLPVTGVVKAGKVYGTQFHPEKSGDAGLRLLKAFAEL
jgi:imidazole glycerol phosphate synthase glutamine amidotransferase subunit